MMTHFGGGSLFFLFLQEIFHKIWERGILHGAYFILAGWLAWAFIIIIIITHLLRATRGFMWEWDFFLVGKGFWDI